jgi:hypothetical protein
MRSVEAEYNLTPEEREEIMEPMEDYSDWKFIAGAMVGFGVGTILTILLILLVAV